MKKILFILFTVFIFINRSLAVNADVGVLPPCRPIEENLKEETKEDKDACEKLLRDYYSKEYTKIKVIKNERQNYFYTTIIFFISLILLFIKNIKLSKQINKLKNNVH